MTVYNRTLEGQLNDILTILGTTKRSLWPFWERYGELVTCIGVGDLIPSETGGVPEDLGDDFAPIAIGAAWGNLYSYHFHPTGDHHLAGIDHADYSFVAAPFSVGAWIRPTTIASNVILAKYDAGVGVAREYRFWIDAAGHLNLELYDEDVDTTWITNQNGTIVPGQMQFVVATYDGVLVTPTITLYVNGVAVAKTDTETGAFVDMEAGVTPLTIGCQGLTALPANEFHGRIALPFLTGKCLIAAEVAELYAITSPLVGLC